MLGLLSTGAVVRPKTRRTQNRRSTAIKDSDEILCMIRNGLSETVSFHIQSWTPVGLSFVDTVKADVEANGRISFVSTLANETRIICPFMQFVLISVQDRPALSPSENISQFSQKVQETTSGMPPWLLSCTLVTSAVSLPMSPLFPPDLAACLSERPENSRFAHALRPFVSSLPPACTVLAPTNDCFVPEMWSHMSTFQGIEHFLLNDACFFSLESVRENAGSTLDGCHITIQKPNQNVITIRIEANPTWQSLTLSCDTHPVRTEIRWQIAYIVHEIAFEKITCF